MAISEYQKQALDFLKETETSIKISDMGVVYGFPFDNRDSRPHTAYNVVLTRGNKFYSFPFYDSTHNYELNKWPTAYDVLACLQSYPVEEDMWDFANEFGYEIHSKDDYERVSNIHHECLRQYRALLDLFGEELLDKLAEIR